MKVDADRVNFDTLRLESTLDRGLIPAWAWPSPLRILRSITRIDRARRQATGRCHRRHTLPSDPRTSFRGRIGRHPAELRPPCLLHARASGAGGRRFRIIKFRSMRCDAERETGPIWASDHDSRCTWIGDWLRHTNIDELPQLFNVLRGDMSVVGPRPERPMFVDQFRHEIPDYDLRHAVPSGMTGWAQVHGWRGRTSLRKRLQYDLDYIHRWSFWLDFMIMLMTIQHVVWGKISWNLSRPAKKLDE